MATISFTMPGIVITDNEVAMKLAEALSSPPDPEIAAIKPAVINHEEQRRSAERFLQIIKNNK